MINNFASHSDGYGPFPLDHVSQDRLIEIEGKRSDIDSNMIDLQLKDQSNYTLLGFLSQRDEKMVEQWLQGLDLEKLKGKPIRFINFVFPGGLFFMIPRTRALGKIKERIAQEEKAYQATMSAEELNIYKGLNITWIADFTAQTWAGLELSKNKSYLILVNPDGKILYQVKSQSILEVEKMTLLLEKIAEKK